MADDEFSIGHDQRSMHSTRLKRVVCTSCRQSKVRCTGPEKASCERCTRLDIDCNRDPGFKRTSRSRKISELEKQVQLLATVVNTRSRSTIASFSPSFGAQISGNSVETSSHPAINSWQSSPNSQVEAVLSLATIPAALSSTSAHTAATTSPERALVRPLALIPRQIETLQLKPDQIDHLFEIFFANHHPFMPFLDPLQSPDHYYKSCPSLFWAIVGIASRRYQIDTTLFTILSEWVTKLIWTEISNCLHKISTVQAILLVALWPFPTAKSTNDTSVTLSSIAITSAMNIGLHRPLNRQDFKQTISNYANEVDFSMLTRTWAVANIVCQSSGAVAGHLPNAPFDWMVDRSCELGNIYTLPGSIRFKVMIQRICHRVTQAMSTISYDPITAQSPPPGEVSSLMMSWQNDMAHFESELNSLEQENRLHLSEMDCLYLGAARIHLHSFYFFDSSLSESRKSGIMKAYDSAINFVSILVSTSTSSETILYLPYYHFRCLLTAACIIIKVLKSCYAQDLAFVEKGNRAFNDSILAIKRSSVSNNDTAGKAAVMLSRAWHSSTQANQYPPVLTIRSRFGACITQDFIHAWRKEFGAIPHSKHGHPITTQAQEPSMTHYTESFQDEMLFNLDFSDERIWDMGIGEVPVFGSSESN